MAANSPSRVTKAKVSRLRFDCRTSKGAFACWKRARIKRHFQERPLPSRRVKPDTGKSHASWKHAAPSRQGCLRYDAINRGQMLFSDSLRIGGRVGLGRLRAIA